MQAAHRSGTPRLQHGMYVRPVLPTTCCCISTFIILFSLEILSFASFDAGAVSRAVRAGRPFPLELFDFGGAVASVDQAVIFAPLAAPSETPSRKSARRKLFSALPVWCARNGDGRHGRTLSSNCYWIPSLVLSGVGTSTAARLW